MVVEDVGSGCEGGYWWWRKMMVEDVGSGCGGGCWW